MDTITDSIRQFDDALLALNQTPLIGYPPPFPWEALAASMQTALGFEDLSLKALPPRLSHAGELIDPISHIVLPLSCPPLEGILAFSMNRPDGELLMARLLSGDRYSAAVKDNHLQDALVQYVALEVIGKVRESGYLEGISISLQVAETVPDEGYVIIDVQVSFEDKLLTCHLLLSNAFTQSMRATFHDKERSRLVKLLRETVMLPVHGVMGHTLLTQKEWKGLKPGDFITLDNYSYDALTGEGNLQLIVQNRLLAFAAVAGTSLEIENLASTYEDVTMNDEPNLSDDDLPPFDEDLFSDELPSLEEASEEDAVEEEAAAELPPEPDELEAVTEEEPPANPLEELTIPLSIEITRLQMSAAKLVELQPGNILELGTNLDEGVTLIAGGRSVGRGELLRVGDYLGVRITELG